MVSDRQPIMLRNAIICIDRSFYEDYTIFNVTKRDIIMKVGVEMIKSNQKLLSITFVLSIIMY